MAAPERSPILPNLTVVDFGLGLAGALIGQMLQDLGASVHRAEPESGDPFYAIYGAYKVWQQGKATMRAPNTASALTMLEPRLRHADLCIVGGEDYPGLEWYPDVESLARAYPRLVILEVTGTPPESRLDRVPAVELLAQASSGLVFEQHPDRPAVYAFPAGSYGAMCQGLIGAFAALCERGRSGRGQIVRTSLLNGVLSWLGHDWYRFERPVDVARDVTPRGAHPLIFRCADGEYLHVVMATPDARKHLYTLLSVANPVPSLEEDPRGLPSITRGVRNYFGDRDLLQRYISNWKRDDLLAALWKAGVAAEAVNRPGEPWSDSQVACNRLLIRDTDGYVRVGVPFDMTFKAGAPRIHEDTSDDRPPLEGLRVVDFGSFAAGPHASMALRDLGADVVKIEPLTGDVMRNYFLKFTASSRGKRIIALDLKQPAGRDIALRLCQRADVVHHNFRPGVTARLGLDVETLLQLKPGLIVLESVAYGLEGPRAQQGGFDMTLQAFCGHELRGCGEGNEPDLYRLPIIDFAAGQIGTLALLVAWLRHASTDEGATIATSLLNCGLHLLCDLIQQPDGRFLDAPRLNREQTGFHPAERLYAAGSEWVAIAARDEPMARRLLETLGLAHEIRAPRSAWGQQEAERIAAVIATWDRDALLQALVQARVWAAACRSDAKEAIFNDPGMNDSAAVVGADDPEYGGFVQLGAQFTLSRSPRTVAGNSPRLGEHTRQVLAELGYSAAEVERLYRAQIVA
jgi:crotonobetainyl-CoA:carnitine CoA-transferase CaiB-like acyl-CoA transferase